MLDDRNDVTGLQNGIEKITNQWFHHRDPWHGISEEKLAATQLPEPLKWLYRFAGEWPSDNWWETVFAYQDRLLPFESLAIEEGKLVFVVENQGVWHAGTLTAEEDPPVWARLNEPDSPWLKVSDSLMQFLVTFCLHETVYGALHKTHVDGILDRFVQMGCHITPLWLDAPYICLRDDQVTRPLSFHLVDGRYLVMSNGFCGTWVDEPWKHFPDLFEEVKHPKVHPIQIHLPLPEDVRIPSFVRQSHLRNLIRRHKWQLDYHQQMMANYQQMVRKLEEG